MRLNTLAAATVAGLLGATPVLADLVFPSLSYRTGPYAAGGIPFADGYADYFTLLNERDGGIGGVAARVLECETAYNTEKGVECYESTKGEGALVYQPLSTGITYQLIPKASADGIPLHTMGYGRTSAANGSVFEWVFNYPANYWNGASHAINHILDENGGDVAGKRVALVYHNSAYGKEPIRTLEELSAANIRFPMENFIGVWWSGSENDVLPAGAGADGYKSLNMHNVGADFPIYDDLKTHVVDKGLAAGAGDQLGTVLYNRGLYAAMLAAEAARTAQGIHGVGEITAAMMRDGMEALEITEARMGELGMPNFGPSFSVSCDNHGGPGLGAVQQWDASAESWSLITDFYASDMEVIQPLITADSEAYAAEAGIEPRGC